MRTLDELTPGEFENLTYDLVQAAGLRNLVWRTPGTDGGRDIEGDYLDREFSGGVSIQRWYVECKRYSSSIDWPTVWEKIAHADGLEADYLLLVTNSNPSPTCESRIGNWNKRRRDIQVRIWRGYELQQILRAYPSVMLKYGLIDATAPVDPHFSGLAAEVMKASQAANAAVEFGGDPVRSLQAASAISELISLRMEQIRSVGRVVTVERQEQPPDFAWLSWQGDAGGWDAIGMRALAACFRYYTGAQSLSVKGTETCATFTASGARVTISQTTEAIVAELARWANIELTSISSAGVMLLRKPYEDGRND